MDEEGEATVWSEGLDEAEVVGVSAAELSALAHFSLQRRVWRLRFEDTLKRRRQISHAQARTTDYTITASSRGRVCDSAVPFSPVWTNMCCRGFG